MDANACGCMQRKDKYKDKDEYEIKARAREQSVTPARARRGISDLGEGTGERSVPGVRQGGLTNGSRCDIIYKQ